MENMDIWNAVKRPPSHALKTIGGGRLKGMTDINPQWRYEVMTEQFGPCGIGWKYEIVSQNTIPCNDGEIAAFVEIKLYIKHDDWSEPIPGVGGSMMCTRESGGLHTNDEAFKMALTDSLSVAMKQIGIAADIYAGLWDGSKYRNPTTTPQSGSPAGKSGSPPPEGSKTPNQTQHWCDKHKVAFRKNTRGYAHTYKDDAGTTQWCNEVEVVTDEVRGIQLCEKCRTTWGILSEQNGKMVCENCVE